MYTQEGRLLYRETGVNSATGAGDGVNYIFLGWKLIAKEGVFSDTGSSLWHYKPFGETIEAPKDEIGYTGHKFDADLELSYMQARYYDPAIGRFYSNDPVGYLGHLNRGNPVHGFGRYTYVNNNPYKYVDPDGEFLNFAAKFVLDVGVNVAFNYVTTGSLNVGSAVKESAIGVLNPAKTVQKVAKLSKELKAAKGGGNFVEGFHGTKAKNMSGIKSDGVMKPDAEGNIFLSRTQGDTFVHGADSSIGGALSGHMKIDVSAAKSVTNISVPGNPNTILIKTDVPLPTTVNSVKVRRPDGNGGFNIDEY